MERLRLLGAVCLTLLVGTSCCAQSSDNCPHRESWKPTQRQLQQILSDHRQWTEKWIAEADQDPDPKPVLPEGAQRNVAGRANFCNVNLEDMRLKDAQLAGASHFHLTPPNPAYGKYKSYAYRFEMPDKVVVFTGDTGPSQSVAELAKNADILVSEVLVIDDFLEILKKNGAWDAMSAERQVGVVRHLGEDHLTPEEVGKLASRAEVKRVVLTHM